MFLLTPRFLALPVIALAVIVGLAQAHGPSINKSADMVASAPSVYRVVNCANPDNAHAPQCALARSRPGETGRARC